MVAGADAAAPGEGKNSWLTGTSAWSFTALSQYILGIRPTLDGLRIDPCIPDSVKGYCCDRVYRGAVYHIEVDNSAGVQHGVRSIFVNGTEIQGTLIPVSKGSAETTIRVVMG